MLAVDRKDFISMLSESLPVMCFFHDQKEDKQIKDIKEVLLNVESNLPKLKIYEFIRDKTPEDEYMCDIMEVAKYPILIIYKNGCFSRYKAKDFTEKEVLKFLGNTTIYENQKPKVIEVDEQ